MTKLHMSQLTFRPAHIGQKCIIVYKRQGPWDSSGFYRTDIVYAAIVTEVDQDGNITEVLQSNNETRPRTDQTVWIIEDQDLPDMSNEMFFSFSFKSERDAYDTLRFMRTGVDKDGYLPSDFKRCAEETTRNTNTKHKRKVKREVDDLDIFD